MNNFLRKMNLRGSAKRWAGKTGIAIAALLLSSGAAYAQLSGTYTICSSGCDYATVQDAADDLMNNGVSGAVTMQISTGQYNEAVYLGYVSGVSSTNTITFKGMGSKNTDVRIYYASGTAWYLDGASYVNFENLHIECKYYQSYNYGLDIESCSYITVKNCRLTASTSSSYIYEHSPLKISYCQDITIKDNYVRGGGEGAIIDGYAGNTRVTIDNNRITKFYYYGIMSYYSTDMTYSNNIIDSNSSGSGQMGILTQYNYGATTFKKNTINACYYGIYGYYTNNGLYKGNVMTNCYYMMYDYTAGTNVVDSNYGSGSTFYYGMQVYALSSGCKITVTRNRIRGSQYYGMTLYAQGQFDAYNNMVDMGTSANYGIQVYPISSAAKVNVAHNTVYLPNGGMYIYLYNGGNATDVKIRNNLLSGNGYIYTYQLRTGNIFDGNNSTRTSSYQASINGTTYTGFANYVAALANFGTGQNEQNQSVTFASAPSDLHLDHTNPAPFGFNAGVSTDYDGDVRCTIMPTVGADETKNTSGDNYKTITGTKFTGPSKTYIDYPTTFFNSAPSTSRLGYAWYVDGVKVSDSTHLKTTKLKYPKSVVKLVAYNCVSVDSFKITVAVDTPPRVPTSDFISDVNVIRQGDIVQFTDLSIDYPSAWKWSITPASGPNGATHSYVYGNDQSQVTRVKFTEPGMYRVCLTASNAKGKGNTECKTDYIEVTPSFPLKTGTNILSGTSGYIYDNGGPNGNTQYAYKGSEPNVRIEGCFDSVYLVFKMFNMYCPYEYVRIYEGKDKSGKALSCTANMYSGFYGPGLTGTAGSTCSNKCSPINNGSSPGTFKYDTFKAAKSMYIEMESYSAGSVPGFEAYYWTKPKSQAKPKTGFSSVDSICTGGVVTFNNTTTGQDVTYLWDLDDDMSAFEATTKNTNWPYFAPGQYKISLIASNCGGPDTFSKTITVFNPATPVTSFIADNVTPTTNDVVFFSKDMPMCVDEYKWTITAASGTGKATYVNGTKNTSTNPNVMFSDTGCYNVSLYTKNVSGEDSLKLNCYIKVRGSYCIPTTQNKAADLGISYVKFNTLENTSTQGLTPYQNFTVDQTKSTTIEIGVTYDLTVARNTNKNKITRTAWIDWNADGDFDDAGEKVGEQINSSTLSWTTPVKVPTLAKTGATILRIAVNQGTQTNTPCGPNVFGEFEDYRVYVRPDATKPVITLNGDDTVYIEQGYTYIDPGATAADNLDGNLTSKVKTSSSPKFDNMTPATYAFKYNVTDAAGNQADEVRRIVIVTPDKTAPDLVVPDPDTIYAEVFDPNFAAPDAVLAEDLVDGDLLSEVQKSGNVNINVVGTYEVVYTVTDASGNVATVKRVVIVQDKTQPVMTLVGNATVTHEVGTPYTDADVTLSDNYYSETELRKVLVVQNNLDVNKLGTYTIVYTLTDPSGNGPVTVTRTIIVVDTQKPVVTLKGDEAYIMEVNNQFMDPGLSINDNYDKNLTTWDTSGTFYATFPDGFADKLGSYTIVYTVTDASGNVTDVTRTVQVKDLTAPTVILLGEPGAMVCRWAEYKDAGILATDNYNKTSELTVTEEGSFTKTRTMVSGQYYLRYKVEDQSGNVTYTAWRRIDVLEPNTGMCTTGMPDNGDMSKYVNVYPNPTSGKFTVDVNLPKTEQVKVTVTNLVGQQIAVVAEGTMSANKLNVDLSNQPSGVYMLNIQTATQNIVKRIVVNR
jgi:PKD repeat protein